MRGPGMALFAVAMLAVAVPLAATASPARATRTYTIVLDRMKFGAVPAGLHVGDTILWVNRDIFQHSATAHGGSFDVDLPPAKSARVTLKQAGRVIFFCKYHPGMTGTLNIAR